MFLALRLRRLLSFSLLTASLFSSAIAFASSLPTTASDDGSWRGMSPQSYGSNGIYDPAQRRMVVFGGEVWSLSLAGTPAWSRLNTAGTAPFVQSAVYDSARNRALVFGGATGNEVWALPLSGTPAWTQLATTGVAPQFASDAVYDPVRDRMLVFSTTRDIFALTLTNGCSSGEARPM